MTGHELQRQLDEDRYAVVPPGETPLLVPLFLDKDTALVGPARQGCKLQGWDSGMVAVVGWRRGLLDDTSFPAAGFRTHGVAHLFSRGTELDLGPCQGGRVQGWSSLASLRVEYEGTRHGSTWVFMEGSEPFEQVLCGVQAGDIPDNAAPSPWLLWWTNNNLLVLSLRYSAIGVWHVVLPAEPTVLSLSVDVTVDLVGGNVTGTVNGAAVAMTCPTGPLVDNFDWPFTVGRADPWCNSNYWSAKNGDVTVTKTRVSSGSWAAQVDYNGGRPATYTGGASLPLLRAWSTNGTRFLFAVHKDQGVADSAGNTTIRGVTMDSPTPNPLVTVGAVQGTLTVADVAGAGGSRFVQCSGLAVVYPVVMADVLARDQKDRQLWLFRASNVSVRDADFGYGGRAAVTLRDCKALLDTVFVGPPTPAQDVVIEQFGGVVSYHRVLSDYEFTPAPPFLRFTPGYLDSTPYAPTTARCMDCEVGTSALVEVRPKPQPTYEGEARVEWNGMIAHLSEE